uniref:Uncharacterized protein n=1 Tax=Sus scrofa TaxID=9823 RepID=A0A4X1WCH3_PIG
IDNKNFHTSEEWGSHLTMDPCSQPVVSGNSSEHNNKNFLQRSANLSHSFVPCMATFSSSRWGSSSLLACLLLPAFHHALTPNATVCGDR